MKRNTLLSRQWSHFCTHIHCLKAILQRFSIKRTDKQIQMTQPRPEELTLTVLGCVWEPEEEVEEEDWPPGFGSDVAGDGESTPVCFWLRGTEAD